MADKKQSRGRPLTGQALKDFRHKVSVLKKKGLVAKKTDARKQRPTRYMTAKVRNLADVFSGKLSPVKRSPKIAREYKEAGFRVINNRLLLPPEQAISVRNRHNEYATMQKPTKGGTFDNRIILPVSVQNIDAFLADENRVNKLKSNRNRFAFTYYKNRSLKTFPEASSLFQYLQHYNVVQGDPQDWEALVLFEISETRSLSWEKEAKDASEEAARIRRSRRKRHNKTGRSIIGHREPMTYEQVKARDRQRKREKFKLESPDKAEARREANKQRMRNKRKALKGSK